GGGVRVVGVEVHVHAGKTLPVKHCTIRFTEDDLWKNILVTHGIQIPYFLHDLLLTCGVLASIVLICDW
ncbi:MAG: hypothetical protein GX097_04760, partial [Methanomicrobiales archaeon]|nr:hypothetical protein [Methanomicrobiales archaeon]